MKIKIYAKLGTKNFRRIFEASAWLLMGVALLLMGFDL